MRKLDIVEAMIAAYNAQNSTAYVAFMTDDAVEANYQGNVLRDGNKGIRDALAQLFDEYPDNNVTIKAKDVFGERIVLKESVFRGAKKGEISGINDEPSFEVLAIYSFEGDKVSRVEFIR